MTKLSIALLATATSTLLVGSAHSAMANCTTDITTKAVAFVTNATFLNTCAPGSTWKLTTLFETANLSASDFLTFCNTTACLHPVHELDESTPEGCVATVNGASVNISDAISKVHSSCHEAVHKAEGGHHAAGANSSTTNSSETKKVPSPAPEATPKKSDATTVSRAAAVVVAVVASTIAAVVL